MESIIHEPFKKTWSEPQIIVSREDEIAYEKSLSQKETQEKLCGNHNESESAEVLTNRIAELRNALLQSELMKIQMCTPKKCENISRDSTSSSYITSSPSQESDWMIPERTKSRSLPSSPILGTISPVSSPSRISSTKQTYFDFLPKNDIRQTDVLERDEVDAGFSRLSSLRTAISDGLNGYTSGRLAESHSLLQDRCPGSADRHRQSPYLHTENQPNSNQPIRAKRKLDMDDQYTTSVKRTKSELSREAGLRYICQLESDIVSLKHRLHFDAQERVTKPSNCACAEMEKHFMEMAMSAYKSVRRYDGSVDGFERFKHELTQTNIIIKDSMELLQNVRRLCVH